MQKKSTKILVPRVNPGCYYYDMSGFSRLRELLSFKDTVKDMYTVQQKISGSHQFCKLSQLKI